MYKVYTIYQLDDDGERILLCEGETVEQLAEKFKTLPNYENFQEEKIEIGLFMKEGDYHNSKLEKLETKAVEKIYDDGYDPSLGENPNINRTDSNMCL